MSEYLYGRQCVREALAASKRVVKAVLMAEGLRAAPILADISRLAERRNVPIRQVSKQQLAAISVHNQGVAAEVGDYPYVEFEDALASLPRQALPLLLALDCLQDPQNFGSLLRTAEAVGVDLVVIPERRQALVTPTVSHASAGAVEHLPVAAVVNLRRALQQMQEHGYLICGLERTASSQPYYRANLTDALTVVVGSESEGLRRLTRETCDLLLELPMQGHVTSLNAAVAGSVVLYEVLRQRL
ncbi:MAG: 23S rRNA (guanosine(2251)-2'-O)-methyltransferase RlmB, partial [Anaerolineae bacterium]